MDKLNFVYCAGMGCELRQTCTRYLLGKDLADGEADTVQWITACPEDRPYYKRKEFYGQ